MRIGSIIPATIRAESHSASRFVVAIGTRASNVTALVAILAVLLFLALPAFASRVLLQELFYVFTMLALAQLWNLLAGCAGLISVGQQAFAGIGAYALFAFTIIAGLDPVPLGIRAGPGRHPWPSATLPNR